MASLKPMHVLLPALSISFFLSLHVVAAHRKLSLNKQLPISRVLMSSSNPNFYNAFDAPHNSDTHNNFNHLADKDGSNFNYQDNAINGFNDIVDSEFTSTNSYGAHANLPSSTSNTHQANGVQYSNPNAYEFSSPSSSLSTVPSLDGGKYFPRSFEASFPGSRSGYGKQSFPSDDQQGLYDHYPSDAKRFFYKSPSARVESSPSEEQSLSKSPSNYEANYNPFHGASDINRAKQFDGLKNNHHVGADSYGFKNEKPVSNYDSFFNSPTIHKSEGSPFERPKFPLSDHDLTYGHVQVP